MTVCCNEDNWDRSNVEFSGGAIVRYVKGDPDARMRHIDYGLGVLSRSVFERVPEGSAYDLALLYQELLERGELAGMEVEERFYEVGSWSGIRDLSEYLSSHPTTAREAR